MTKPTSLWIHLPLAQAYLCPDCDSVGNLVEQCPACGNVAVLPLAQVLKTGQKRESPRVVDAVGVRDPSEHDLYAGENGHAHCTVCGGAEGTLTSECSGEPLSKEEEDMIWAGVLDFRAGTWERLT